MAAFKHRAVSFGTPDVPPPDVASSIGPISLHNAIKGAVLVLATRLPKASDKKRSRGGVRTSRDPGHEGGHLMANSDSSAHDAHEPRDEGTCEGGEEGSGCLYLPEGVGLCGAVLPGLIVHGDLDYLQVIFDYAKYQLKITKRVKIAELGEGSSDVFIVSLGKALKAAECIRETLA